MVFIENSQSQPKAELQRRFTMIKIHKEHQITIYLYLYLFIFRIKTKQGKYTKHALIQIMKYGWIAQSLFNCAYTTQLFYRGVQEKFT